MLQVLDESQMIKNKATQASKVVAELEADYRWTVRVTSLPL